MPWKSFFIAMLLFLASGWASGSTSTGIPGDWVLSFEKNGIQIFTRAIEDSKLKQIKAVTEIPAPLDRVIQFLKDISNYKNWVSNMTESKIIKTVSDTCFYVYEFHDSPWPVQNRYNVSQMTIKSSPDTYTILFNSVQDYIEKRADALEMQRSQVSWNVSPLPGGGCHIEYLIDENPGGYVPPWLINYMAEDAPYKTLLNLKNALFVASGS
jgi:hypothetical protein